MRELSLNVMDITQNSISAEASFIEIEITDNTHDKTLTINISDNGRGMSEEQVKKVIDPFYTTRTTRDVGLGVPLFKMEAEMTGGSFSISSHIGKGTRLTAVFRTDSIDMIPLGDIDAVVYLLITCNPMLDFRYVRRCEPPASCQAELDTREIKEILGDDVPLSAPDVAEWLKAYLHEQTTEYLARLSGAQSPQ